MPGSCRCVKGPMDDADVDAYFEAYDGAKASDGFSDDITNSPEVAKWKTE